MRSTEPQDGQQQYTDPRREVCRLTRDEVTTAFTGTQYGPILDLEQAAEIAHRAPSTMKRLVSEGKFDGCVARGKPLLFWRDKLVIRVMGGLS